MSSDPMKFRIREATIIEGISPEVTLEQQPNGVQMTVKDKAGTKTALIPKGDSYVLTEADKEQIADAAFESFEAAAEADVRIAEGWAKGTQDDVPVESGSSYYHDNAKYYSEQAADSAEDADTAKTEAQTAAASASAAYGTSLLAPNFSTESTYAVGDYVIYSGNLYRCTTAVTTAGAWNNSSWSQVAVGGEFSSVKSAIDLHNEELYTYSGKTIYSTSSGYRLNSNGLATADSSYKLVKYSVTSGSLIKVVSDDRFQFNNGSSVPVSGSSTMVGHSYGSGNYVLEVPNGATYLILSTPVNDGIAVAYNAKGIVGYLQTAVTDESQPLYKTEISDASLHPFWITAGEVFTVATSDGSTFGSGKTIHLYDKDGAQTAYWTLTSGNSSFEVTYPTGRAQVFNIEIRNASGKYIVTNNSSAYNVDGLAEKVGLLNYQVLISSLNEYVPFYAKQGTSITFKTQDGNNFPSDIASIELYNKNKTRLHYYALSGYGKSRTITIPSTDADPTYFVNFLNAGGVAYPVIVVNNSSLEAQQDAETDARITALENETPISFTERYISNGTLNDRRDVEKNSDIKLIFFSDIHAGNTNMDRIVELSNALGDVDAIINGGDTVQSFVSDNIDWYNTAIDNADADVLTCVGNHDIWSQFYVTADRAEIYTKFIAPVASKVSGIVQPSDPTSGKCYYYKDYGDIRVIILAAMSTGSDAMLWDSDQLTWFQSVLSDALTNSKKVLCVDHSPFVTAKADIMEDSQLNTWQPYPKTTTWDYIVTNQQAVDAVNTFITNGGEFICWLTGHTHRDNLLTETDYQNQFMINIASAKYMYHQDGYSPNASETDATNYDCFDYIGIDTTNKMIKVWRIGFNQDASMRVRNRFCYNYGTMELMSGS